MLGERVASGVDAVPVLGRRTDDHGHGVELHAADLKGVPDARLDAPMEHLQAKADRCFVQLFLEHGVVPFVVFEGSRSHQVFLLDLLYAVVVQVDHADQTIALKLDERSHWIAGEISEEKNTLLITYIITWRLGCRIKCAYRSGLYSM